MGLSLLSSCGYRWGAESFDLEKPPKIFISTIEGDADGALMTELARAITVSGFGGVVRSQSDYILQVAMHSQQGQMIGYRRDRQKINGEIRKNLVASEKRKILTAKVSLTDSLTGACVFGPISIEVSSEFDYVDGDSIQDLVFIDPNGVSQVVLPFSLGQLESYESAAEAANRPLYVALTQKIIEAICAVGLRNISY